jgi:hypothetical protein
VYRHHALTKPLGAELFDVDGLAHFVGDLGDTWEKLSVSLVETLDSPKHLPFLNATHSESLSTKEDFCDRISFL